MTSKHVHPAFQSLSLVVPSRCRINTLTRKWGPNLDLVSPVSLTQVQNLQYFNGWLRVRIAEFPDSQFYTAYMDPSGNTRFILSSQMPLLDVFAIADGTFCFYGCSTETKFFTIKIRHNDYLFSRYELVNPCISDGNWVEQGQKIGTLGSGAAGLCFSLEIRENGISKMIDPTIVMPDMDTHRPICYIESVERV